MTFTDQIGHTFTLLNRPKRIVSVVPSQTELLFDFGLEEEVVGITKFCIYPIKWFKNKKRVGGTKNLKLHEIDALYPDFIIANKEENTQEQIEFLQQKYPVFTSDIATLNESLEMIKMLGEILGKTNKSEAIISKINKGFTELASMKSNKQISVLYLIWKNPYMSIGGNTFINDMIEESGFKNVLSSESRYPIIDEEKIKTLNPDCIFLSSEPYPFKEKHIKIMNKIVPNTKVILVDGELFSWYGSRLIYSSQYFIDLIDNLT
jgi:ABC-type Fe3+-hydroxamate transport system substrate-binding protein